MTPPPHDPKDPSRRKGQRRKGAILDLKAKRIEGEAAPATRDAGGAAPAGPFAPEAAPAITIPEAAPEPAPAAPATPVTVAAADPSADPGSGGPRPRARVYDHPEREAAPAAASDESVPVEGVPESFPSRTPSSGSGIPAAGRSASAPEASSPPHAPTPERPAARDGRRGFGIGGLLTASLLGGLAGGALILAAESWRRQPSSRIEARLGVAEERLGRLATTDALSALERRLAGLETEQKATAERVRAAQQGIETATAQAQQALNRPAPPAAPAPSPAAPSIDPAALNALERRLAALTSEGQSRSEASGQALQTLERRLADQDQRLAALAKQFAERGPDSLAAGLRVVVTDRLGDALREGASYGEALAALRRLNVDPARLAPLEPFAAGGAPTAASLAQEFKPLGDRIVAEARQAADQSWTDRLWRMADQVVTVRPIGETDAATPAGVVARIEAALRRGAFAEAAKAWEGLPEPARQATRDWGQRVQARAAAEQAARALNAEALSALEAATR